jgi:hypothetical protein
MTGLDPDLHFDKHKAGIQPNRFIRDYALRLLPKLCALYGTLSYDDACALEVELAIAFREARQLPDAAGVKQGSGEQGRC